MLSWMGNAFLRRVPPPLLAWTLWVAVGTVFFSCYDHLGWALGFFQSMNIGWSVGWVLPQEAQYDANAISVIFSLVHTLVGVLFSGFAVLYIAKELDSGNRGWAFQGSAAGGGGSIAGTGASNKEAAEQAGSTGRQLTGVQVWQQSVYRCRVRCQAILPTIAKNSMYVVLTGWFLVGWGWYWLSFHPPGAGVGRGQGALAAADYALSTLAGAGYKGIPGSDTASDTASSSDSVRRVQFVLSALYAAVAIPLMRISEGEEHRERERGVMSCLIALS